jgi:hypothetical protein
MYRGRFATVLPRAEASADVLGPYMTGAGGSADDDDDVAQSTAGERA